MKKFIPVAIMLIIIAIIWITGIGDYISKDNLLENKILVQTYIQDNYLISVILFITLYAFTVALSLPFASLLTLTGGFLFGFITGTIAVVIAATIGATIIFWIAKSSFGESLRNRAGKLYSKIEGEMNDNAVSYLFFLRLVPIFPFFLVNIVPALFNIKTRIFIITTFFGILPGTAVYVNVGRSLDTIENPSDLISSDIIVAIAALGVFAIIPTLYKKYKNKKDLSQ